MKALVCRAFGPIENLVIEDLPTPVPGPGQVLIDVRASALNFPDALIVQGLYQVKPALPFSPGAEVSGVVRAVGPDVHRIKVGDQVTAATVFGGLAEQCLAEERRVTVLPKGMDFANGAAFVFTCGTALHALRGAAQLKAGETVLVLGAAGGVGLAGVAIAKAMGARVIAAASSAAKLALCTKAGADAVVDYSAPDWRKAVEAHAGGDGVDVVLDPVGGAYAEPALRTLAWRGRYVVVGFAAGDIPRIPLNLVLLKERRILGVLWGEAMRRDPALDRENMQLLTGWYEAGKLTPAIVERLPLTAAVDAIQRMARREVLGRVVIDLTAG